MGSDAMGTPRLAGQGYPFLVKQLEDFATDKRMDTTMFIMNVNAKGLSSEDRRDVATYANSLTKENSAPSNMKEVKDLGNAVGIRHLGKAIVTFGDVDRGIPSCYSCHGFNGRGAAPVYPVIGGQKYVYLVSQLKKWRDGSRANDPMAQMQAVAKNLSDDESGDFGFVTNDVRATDRHATAHRDCRLATYPANDYGGPRRRRTSPARHPR